MHRRATSHELLCREVSFLARKILNGCGVYQLRTGLFLQFCNCTFVFDAFAIKKVERGTSTNYSDYAFGDR
jgi:hypothetical protein